MYIDLILVWIVSLLRYDGWSYRLSACWQHSSACWQRYSNLTLPDRAWGGGKPLPPPLHPIWDLTGRDDVPTQATERANQRQLEAGLRRDCLWRCRKELAACSLFVFTMAANETSVDAAITAVISNLDTISSLKEEQRAALNAFCVEKMFLLSSRLDSLTV